MLALKILLTTFYCYCCNKEYQKVFTDSSWHKEVCKNCGLKTGLVIKDIKTK